MSQSPSIAKLAEALAKAQAHYGKAIKDASNPFFKSKYVDLAGCYEACRGALAAQGLTIVQTTDIISTTELLVLNSSLIHSSGEWITGSYPIKPVKADPQGVGSAITYARRYALMALVGLAAEDDDGNEASGKPVERVVKGEVVKKKPEYSPEQKEEAGKLRAEAIELGGEVRFNDLWYKMGYKPASEFIDTATELVKELRDIADQANQGVQS